MKKIPLIALAHARSGDKGNMCNIGLIARRLEHYPLLVEHVMPRSVSRSISPAFALGKWNASKAAEFGRT